MEVFKIAKEEHAKFLSSSGVENRWNRKGEFVIYAASSRSLAALELVAHRSAIMPKKPYKSIIISIDEDVLIKTIDLFNLPEKWNKLEAYPKLQEMGSKWYHAMESLALKVPSAIIPQEYNYVINTKHPLFLTKVSLLSSEDFNWDERLL